MFELNIFVLLGVGFVGYIVFVIFDLPSPALIGPFAFVGFFNLLGIGFLDTPDFFNISLQILLGLFIGVKITKEVIKNLKNLFLPAALIGVWSVFIAVGIGYFLHRITDLDIITTILAASPAGLAEMSIIAMSTDSDVASVGVLHTIRMILTLILFPIFANRMKATNSKDDVSKDSPIIDRIKCLVASLKSTREGIKKLLSVELVKTFAIAIAGGIIGGEIGIPAGGMLGAFFLITIVNLKITELASPPYSIRVFLQIGIGSLIGLNISKEALIAFQEIIVPTLLFIFLIFASSYLMALLIENVTGWEKVACFISTAPAGITPMTILAYDLDAKPVEVSILHLTRLIVIKTLIPISIAIMT